MHAIDFQSCRSLTGPVYTLPNTRTNGNFALAISGPQDIDGVLLPVRVDTSINYESPQIVDGSNTRPRALSINLTITLSELKEGVHYNLYRYNNESSVPDSNFNANRNKAVSIVDVVAPPGSTTFSMTQAIMSDEKAIYRCVSATSP